MKKVVIALAGLFFLSASVVEARKLDDVKNLEKALGKQVVVFVGYNEMLYIKVKCELLRIDENSIKISSQVFTVNSSGALMTNTEKLISIKNIIGVDLPRHKLTRWLTFGLASKYVAIYMRSDVLKRYKESKK